jgi:hypothetical protein
VDLDIGQVRALVVASESGSFGRAAAQLYMSQQALSKRIARLETSLGTLFTRSPGGVTLTALDGPPVPCCPPGGSTCGTGSTSEISCGFGR